MAGEARAAAGAVQAASVAKADPAEAEAKPEEAKSKTGCSAVAVDSDGTTEVAKPLVALVASNPVLESRLVGKVCSNSTGIICVYIYMYVLYVCIVCMSRKLLVKELRSLPDKVSLGLSGGGCGGREGGGPKLVAASSDHVRLHETAPCSCFLPTLSASTLSASGATLLLRGGGRSYSVCNEGQSTHADSEVGLSHLKEIRPTRIVVALLARFLRYVEREQPRTKDVQGGCIDHGIHIIMPIE